MEGLCLTLISLQSNIVLLCSCRCDQKFAFHCVLCMHKRTIHRKQRPMTCMVCGKKIFGKSYMEIHMRRHAELKPFKCGACKKGFVTAQDLKQHRRLVVIID